MDAQARRESELIRHHFAGGFEYEEITMQMFRRNGVRMSVHTLIRRLSILSLRRRHRQYNVELVHTEIRTLMDGPNSFRGCRAMWH